MTAILAIVSSDKVFLAMDTLVTNPGDGTPRSFASKMLPLPHLKSLVCGTGVHEYILQWFMTLQTTSLPGNDVRAVESLADELLGVGWRLYAAQNAHLSSTIYHFGYDNAEGRFRAFMRKSDQNFATSELGYSFVSKPPVPPRDTYELPQTFIELMSEQRAIDAELPLQLRAGIGGELQVGLLELDSISITTCHRFADYEQQRSDMVGRRPAV